MASAAVKDRLNRLGQGVLQPAAGLAALVAILRAAARVRDMNSPVPGSLRPSPDAGAAASAVVTVNPFKWRTYLDHMKVRCDIR